MNLQMLNAVGPGVVQGQQQAAQLAASMQENQARQKAIADAAAAEHATAWMRGGGLAQALGGLATPVPGGASPMAMPGPLPSPVAAPQGGGIGGPPPPPAPPVSQPDASGVAYGEPTIDKLTRLLIGEAGGEDDRGQMAVASVVRNRARQSGLTLDDVIAAPKQFEPYGNAKRWAELQSIDTSNPAYIRARTNAMRILQGEVEDPTGGADHFYSPSGQRFLGRPTPDWDNGTGADLGRHRFFKLGYNGQGVPRTSSEGGDVAPAAAGQDAAATEPVGHPAEPDYGQTYSPMDSLRMTMQLADFIGARYKEVTGEELAPNLLMDQVERVAKLSNQFTGAQRLAVQQGVAGLRSSTMLQVQDEKSKTQERNTDVRTGTQLQIAQGHDITSRDNTIDRVGQSDTNNRRSTETSASNNAANNSTRRDLAADSNALRKELAAAKDRLSRDVAAGRNTTASNNAVVAAQGRVDAARIQAGTKDAPAAAPPAAPAYLNERGERIDPIKPAAAPGAPATAAPALPPAAIKQLKAGVKTTFANNQVWTLENGQPKRLK